tara:strand:- start:1007 stop:1597 length:591 start_codon:yes stop_codon:yes gene_type:complete
LDISKIYEQGWFHLPVKGLNEFRITIKDDELAIMAEGSPSGNASGLIRFLDEPGIDCSDISWRWQNTRIQSSANLIEKSTDDVAAAIYVLFGDPGMMSLPNPVPTLRYVWTTHAHKVGDIIPNPYLPNYVRNVVIKTGISASEGWVDERRDMHKDFVSAFGHSPKEGVHAVAIFVDNDQTDEPVTSFFGNISMLCK